MSISSGKQVSSVQSKGVVGLRSGVVVKVY
jgi:hypothetical protein